MASVQRQSSSGSDGCAVDDKKRKKMESNRESARRSRMKKQKHVEELTVEITRLQISNNQIRQSIDAKDKPTASYFLVIISSSSSALRSELLPHTIVIIAAVATKSEL